MDKFKCFVVDKKVSMIKILKKAGVYSSLQGNLYCPFHDDSNHKSAKVYRNEDGTESLFCFAERKIYRPSDAIKLLLNLDIDKTYTQVWSKIGDIEKRQLKDNFEKPMNYVPQG